MSFISLSQVRMSCVPVKLRKQRSLMCIELVYMVYQHSCKFLTLCCSQSLAVEVMDFNLLTDSEARSPALSLSDSGTPQHDPGCKGQDNSGQYIFMFNHQHTQIHSLLLDFKVKKKRLYID